VSVWSVGEMIQSNDRNGNCVKRVTQNDCTLRCWTFLVIHSVKKIPAPSRGALLDKKAEPVIKEHYIMSIV